MIDIYFLRAHPEIVANAAHHKGVAVNIEEILQLDERCRKLRLSIDQLEQRRNEVARAVGQTTPTSAQIAEGRKLKEQLATLEVTWREVHKEFTRLLRLVPNIPSEDTPIGRDETGNVVLRTVGERPTFTFTPQPHWILGEALGIIDNAAGARVAGSRFTYLKGELVWLQFALIQHAFTVLTQEKTLKMIQETAGLTVSTRSFQPVIPPVLVKPEIMDDMARLEPREERYYIPSDDLYLVGSAEHTLGPLHQAEQLAEDRFPLRYVGYSTAFRREAGSHGKDVRGILRVHQFDKIELESFTLPEHSRFEQDFIVAIQEYLMQSLGLPYQVVLKCTGDMGAPNARAIDIETWMPGQNQYRETHTSDLMTDYQSRRLGIKVKRTAGGREYVHMNDATVFAIGRTLIAIMENYQQDDGSILVPEVLRAYVPFRAIAR